MIIDIPLTTEDDVKKTIPIVKDELKKHNIEIQYDDLVRMTLKVMAISYGKGGGYSEYEIRSYTRDFIEGEIYKKFISK